MKWSSPSHTRSWIEYISWGVLASVVVFARHLFPLRDFDAHGLIAIRDLIITLSLWILVIGLSFGLGTELLKILRPDGVSRLEHIVFGFALGSGCLAYLVMVLGFINRLNISSITIMLIALSTALAPKLTRYVRRLLSLPGLIWAAIRHSSLLVKCVLLVGLVIALLGLLNTLVPPWDYDGLMYHLVGPKIFLEEGGLFPYPDNWYVNAPFTIEMLFTIGITFGDDIFPKLVHFSMGLLYVGATYMIAQRWLKPKESWLSIAVLLGVPILPVWASFAYIDFGWSAFEFLALCAMLIWWQEGDLRWLILSGTLIGLAMGSKYLGLVGFGLLGIFLLFVSRREGWRSLLRRSLLYGLPAIIIACPWYLKNWLWFDNPIYPLILGGPGWNDTRIALYNAYLASYGSGRSLLDFILLPLNIYTQHVRFGAVMNQIDIPNVLFLLVFLYPLCKRNRFISTILMITAGRILFWWLGSHQTRFLLPVFPALAIATAYVITRLITVRPQRTTLHLFLPLLALGLTVITIYYQMVLTIQFKPLGVVIGTESREGFLARIVKDYPAVAYIQKNLPDTDRILLLGDGRGYYCLPQCMPDPDHFRWAGEIATLPDLTALRKWFSQMEVTHILLSWEDLDFLLQHDPMGVIEKATRRLLEWRDSGCLRNVFSDNWVELYEITCTSP